MNELKEIKELLLLVIEGQRAFFKRLDSQDLSAEDALRTLPIARADWENWQAHYREILDPPELCVSCDGPLKKGWAKLYTVGPNDGPFCSPCFDKFKGGCSPV